MVEPCTVADYLAILADLDAFWGSDRTRALHHPMFVRELGDSAFVIRDGARVVAYLFGFCSQAEPVGYVHLVAVREGRRQRGLARRLYEQFMAFARARGCHELRAITTPGNHRSIAFHTALGMRLTGTPNADGVPVVPDYSGQGEARVVFGMALGPGSAPAPPGRESPAVTVRAAAPSDGPALARLAGGFATSFTFDPAAFRVSFAELLQSGSAHLAVADAGGKVVGYVLGFEHPTFYANGRVGWVEEITVDEGHRGRGIGRSLTEGFERWAKARGCRLVALATRRAAGFYRALGYGESAAYFRKLLRDDP